MNRIQIAGDAQSALTHFALYGLANIIQDELDQPVFVSFTDEVDPKAVIETDATDSAVAEAVSLVAERWSDPESWVQGTLTYPDKIREYADRSPFSPRIQGFDDPDMWKTHQAFRHSHLDQLAQDNDYLALRLIAGLGEPSYWRFQRKARRPDHGASRWEMITRTQGKEFIASRFAPMCAELSTWDKQDLLAGIIGAQINDSLATKKAESRTSTGLTTPRPTDVALAFCGLVGLGSFPVLPQSAAISVTPAAYPRNVLHTQRMVLPIPAQAVTMSRLEGILVSAQLAHASYDGHENWDDEKKAILEQSAARKWLHSRGMGALVHFSVLKTGSSSAPERQVLTGSIEAL